MTTTAHLKAVPANAAEISFQPASLDIWEKKYRLKTKDGKPVDETIDDTYQRVARALADVEDTQELRERWYREFHHFQCRRPGTQAGDIDHQLHRLRHYQ